MLRHVTLHVVHDEHGMSAHQKLMQARIALQGKKLSKSGKNKFAGYSYFELGDFLPTVQEIFLSLGLSGVVSYGKEEATLKITDCENSGDSISICSPMSSAALKGAHEIQNLGAVQTYLRRYLWVTAMEIVEHDALDAVLGSETTTGTPKAATGGSRGSQKPLESDAQLSGSKPPVNSVNQRLHTKLIDTGITTYGLKTILAITDSTKFEDIPEAKATAMLSAMVSPVDKEFVKMFNKGQNSKGKQIIPEPVADQLSGKNSIDELATAADEAFGDD